MELGTGYNATEDGLRVELGLTWVKLPYRLEERTQEAEDDTQRALDDARQHGMKVVMDLRTLGEWLRRQTDERLNQMNADGLLEEINEDWPRREIVAAMYRNEQLATLPIVEWFGDACGEAALRYGAWCDDYEIWGECGCPWVSGGAFDPTGNHDVRVYSNYLAAAYGAIKQAQPQARVWTGGNGMTNRGLDPAYFTAILDDGQGQSFDVSNWHPYKIQIDPTHLPAVEMEHVAAEFGDVRADLRARGKNQPFAATEWGYPNMGALPAEFEKRLRSHVPAYDKDGVQWLTAPEAQEWMAADLQVMEEAGFQVVCLPYLRDTHAEGEAKGRYWGDVVGVLNADGTRKPSFQVIQEWGHKGRRGRKAFADWGAG
jgi:hypothetical protein